MALSEKKIERIARSAYRIVGWDRPWDDIDESGRERWRELVRLILSMAK